MAATTVIQETNGASTGTATTMSGIRFKHADSYDTSSFANPMVKPASGQVDRSYIKWLSLYCSNFGTSNQITNGKFYLTNSTTGFTFYAKTDSSAYSQSAADAASGLDSSWPALGAGNGAVNPVNGGTTTATPLNFLTTIFTSASVPGRIGQYVQVYLKIGETVGSGVQTGPQFTFQYDEV